MMLQRNILVMFVLIVMLQGTTAQEDSEVMRISASTMGQLVLENEWELNAPGFKAQGQAVFSPNGRWVAISSVTNQSRTHRLIVWEVDSEKEVFFLESEYYITPPEFSPDSQWMTTGEGLSDSERQFFVYQTADFSQPYAQVAYDNRYNNGMAGSALLLVNEEGIFHYIDPLSPGTLFWADSSQVDRSFNQHRLNTQALIAAYADSNDGRWVAYLTEAGQVWVWETTTPEIPPKQIQTDGFFVNNIQFSSDNSTLFLAHGSYLFSPDGMSLEVKEHLPIGVMAWDLEGSTVQSQVTVDTQIIGNFLPIPNTSTLLLLNCNNFLVMSCDDLQFQWLNLADGTSRFLKQEGFSTEGDFVWEAKFSRDGTHFIVGTSASFTQLPRYELYTLPDFGQLFSSDSPIMVNRDSTLILTNTDGTFSILEGTDNALIYQEADFRVTLAVFSPQEDSLVVFGETPDYGFQAKLFRLTASTPQTTAISTVAEAAVSGVALSAYHRAYGTRTNNTVCTIEEGDSLLAVARSTDRRYVLAYTGGKACEGAVWVERAIGNWESSARNPGNNPSATGQSEPATQPFELSDLPTLERPESPYRPVIGILPRYDTLCASASTQGSLPPQDKPYDVFIGQDIFGRELFPEALQAKSVEETEAVLCMRESETVVQTCEYTGGITVRRIRIDETYQLLDYKTGNILAERTFTGRTPESCYGQINTANYRSTLKARPEVGTWVTWLASRIDTSTPVITRSTTQSGGINARSEASTSSTILQSVPGNTPITPIARNEAGDWIVALLPDHTKAWLFADLLRIAPVSPLEALPVFDGLAQDAPISLE